MDDHREWLIVGRVAKPHGVHGEVVAEIITDFPERFVAGLTFGVGPEKGAESFHEVHRVRFHRGRWLFSVVDIRTREPVDAWRGQFLFLPEIDRKDLPEGFYYEHQLAGLQCQSPEGEALGEITGLDQDETQIRIVVRRDGRDYSVPWVPVFILSVDLDTGIVVIDAPPGLLDDDAVEG